jgi:predicted Zn-dependent peptidase
MKLTKLKLKNNLSCLLIDEPFYNSIYVSLFVKVGGNDETYGKSKNIKDCTFGLAHFCEHLLFTGTQKRNKKGEIYETAQSLGGRLNAYTADDHTKYHLQYPKKYEKNAIELLSDMYFCSNFSNDSFEGEKNIVNEEYKLRIDDPEIYLNDISNLINFKGCKYETCSPDILEKCTNKYTKKQLLDFFYYYYRPENCYLVYCGRKDNETIKMIENFFGKDWPNLNCIDYNVSKKSILSYKNKWYPNVNYPEKSKYPRFMKKLIPNVNYYNFKRKVSKSYFNIGFPNNFYYKNLNDISCAKLFSLCTSGYMSSRLMKKLRVDKSLIYGIDSDITLYKKIKNYPATCFNIVSSTDNDTFDKVIKILVKELILIKENGFNDKEIDSAKNYALANLTYALENIDNIVDYYGVNKITDNKIYSVEDKIKSINSISKKDINKFAKMIIDFDNINFLNM